MIRRYSVDQYIEALTEFHGSLAPGLLLGGIMVSAGIERTAEYESFAAISESPSCLPDAIQMLTPCTAGNGLLQIINTGRYAVILYEKQSGNGVRIGVNAGMLERYHEIQKWFMRLIPGEEQDKDAIIREIRIAGNDILSVQAVTVSPRVREKRAMERISVCGVCGEPCSSDGSGLCLACQGMDLFEGKVNLQ